eukprot:TRINITY_DN12345_c0_g1_i6.p3 TRINITY_DN12345_c0_g1~~TRINITY_DN12345_c0_g1_i6.p3  ORF type:complete len:140 (-),score=33.14 TRINITY_DN12345_c0_g1_i6:159-578(-)
MGLEGLGDSVDSLNVHMLLLLLLNGLVGTVLSDLLWAHSVRLLGPVIPSVGLGLTIPLAMLAQVALGERVFSFWYTLGAASTLGGFSLVALPDDDDSGYGVIADSGFLGDEEEGEEEETTDLAHDFAVSNTRMVNNRDL